MLLKIKNSIIVPTVSGLKVMIMSKVTLDEALALGFNSVEDCMVHQSWLAQQQQERLRISEIVSSGSSVIDLTPKELKEGDSFFGYVCNQRAGILTIGEKNNSGGISTVKFTKEHAQKMVDLISNAGYKAFLSSSSSLSTMFSVSFHSKPNL